MNTVTLLLKMGCICGKETLEINNRKFAIRSRLGEGGFSYVDLIEDMSTHKLYALKRITCHSKEEERTAMQEVKIMQTIHHPNIIPLEEFSLVAINRYTKTLDIVSEVNIVMPFYRRGSLLDRIESLCRRGERMKEDAIWEMFLVMCRAVRALHHHDTPYAHRDLKPANIMLADDDTPVVMDLGSAAKARVEIKNSSEGRALQELAAERCFMQYRAPELFNVESNSTIDERTDVWSLGCILYAMAYLESPFEQAHLRGDSIALAVLGRNCKFPEHTGYTVSMEDTIKFLMAVNPMERPFINQVIERVESILHMDENRV